MKNGNQRGIIKVKELETHISISSNNMKKKGPKYGAYVSLTSRQNGCD